MVDHRTIRDKRWYLPIVLLNPAILLASYGGDAGAGRPPGQRGSVLAAVLCHDLSNVGVSLLPNDGSDYDPAVAGVALAGLPGPLGLRGRVASAAEHGQLSVQVRLFADQRDRRHLTGLLHQVLLTILAATAGIMAVLPLAPPAARRSRPRSACTSCWATTCRSSGPSSPSGSWS